MSTFAMLIVYRSRCVFSSWRFSLSCHGPEDARLDGKGRLDLGLTSVEWHWVSDHRREGVETQRGSMEAVFYYVTFSTT
jgi:hypothetical protein